MTNFMLRFEVTPIVGAGFPTPKSVIVEARSENELVSILHNWRRPSDRSIAWDPQRSKIGAYFTWKRV